MKADHVSNCDYCDEPIEIGQIIRRHEHYGWVHADRDGEDCWSAIREAEEEGSAV